MARASTASREVRGAVAGSSPGARTDDLDQAGCGGSTAGAGSGGAGPLLGSRRQKSTAVLVVKFWYVFRKLATSFLSRSNLIFDFRFFFSTYFLSNHDAPTSSFSSHSIHFLLRKYFL